MFGLSREGVGVSRERRKISSPNELHENGLVGDTIAPYFGAESEGGSCRVSTVSVLPGTNPHLSVQSVAEFPTAAMQNVAVGSRSFPHTMTASGVFSR